MFLPEKYIEWLGKPLLLERALYGYTYSGKFLYEDIAEYLKSLGFYQCPSAPALWRRRSKEGHMYFVLQYSDDILHFGESHKEYIQFNKDISDRFLVESTERASWYLQARITQDADGNVTFDQSRYAKAIVERYLPNAPACPTKHDLIKYADPLPKEFKWTIEDKSEDMEATRQLEREFGFRLIEVAGSFNYLSNSILEEIFALRKMCRHTQVPGHPHFVATLHLLNHFRCYPPNALKYYANPHHSPFANYLTDAGFFGLDPGSLIYSYN